MECFRSREGPSMLSWMVRKYVEFNVGRMLSGNTDGLIAQFARDPERGAAFFRGLFGWTLEPRESGDGYGISSTTVYGGIVGGREGTRPALYFSTDDVANAAAAVHEFGGHAGELVEFSEGASVD